MRVVPDLQFSRKVHPQYQRYCLNYSKALSYLDSLKKDEDFQEFMKVIFCCYVLYHDLLLFSILCRWRRSIQKGLSKKTRLRGRPKQRLKNDRNGWQPWTPYVPTRQRELDDDDDDDDFFYTLA